MAQIKPPDYSFKNEIPLSAVMDEIANKNVRQSQLDNADAQRRQQTFENIRQAVSDGSNAVQQMVQASVTRQHAIAVKTLGSLLARQNEPTPAPGTVFGPQPDGALSAGISGPQPSGMLNQPAPVPFGKTPDYQAQLESGLFNAAPAEASKQQLEQIYSEKRDKGNAWEPAKPMLIDGQPRLVSMNPASGAIRDASTFEMLNGKKVEPYVPPSSYGQTRLEIAGQQDLASMGREFNKAVTDLPSAKAVIAGDNFSNQVDRVVSGEVVADKSIMGGLITEAERAFASAGVPSEKRMESIMPKTFKGTLSDFLTAVKNEPTSRDAIKFLKNLQVEVNASVQQKRANVNQVVGGILAKARLAQRTDPEGYNRVVRSWGIDPSAAKFGKTKFLTGASSLFYGNNADATGSPPPTQDQKALLRQKLGLSNGEN